MVTDTTSNQSVLRDGIHQQAARLGCLAEVASLPDVSAIRFLQQREGYTPCFGRETPLIPAPWSANQCGQSNCFWRVACENYRAPSMKPIDSVLTEYNANEVDRFVERLFDYRSRKDRLLAGGGVGLKIKSFGRLPSATRKMLVATPQTVVGEDTEDRQRLIPFVIQQSSSRSRHAAGGPNLTIQTQADLLFTTDARALMAWMTDTSQFLDDGLLTYYPIIETITGEREIGPHGSGLPSEAGSNPAYPLAALPSTLNFKTFSAPHVGLPDGEIMLTDPNFAPILNLDLPVLENIDSRTLHQLMADHPEELCSFRDYLQAKVEEMRTAVVGSTEFVKDCSRIERDIREHLRKLDSDYKKSRLTAAFALTGCAVAAWTLGLYTIVQGANNVLTLLGPGGLTWTATAAYSDYLTKKLDLSADPVHFLWLIGKTERRK